jgi:hypothetical protein
VWIQSVIAADEIQPQDRRPVKLCQSPAPNQMNSLKSSSANVSSESRTI